VTVWSPDRSESAVVADLDEFDLDEFDLVEKA